MSKPAITSRQTPVVVNDFGMVRIPLDAVLHA